MLLFTLIEQSLCLGHDANYVHFRVRSSQPPCEWMQLLSHFIDEVQSFSPGHTAALQWSQDSSTSLENSKGSVPSRQVLERKSMGVGAKPLRNVNNVEEQS